MAGRDACPTSPITSNHTRTRCDHGFGFAPGADADLMSDMKTFTVRDLDRAPAIVLAACARDTGAMFSGGALKRGGPNRGGLWRPTA